MSMEKLCHHELGVEVVLERVAMQDKLQLLEQAEGDGEAEEDEDAESILTRTEDTRIEPPPELKIWQ